jgi:hypothetical protein
MFVDSDQKIRELCGKVTSIPESADEFEPALQQLKAAIHEHLSPTRERLLALEFLTAHEKRSKAA